jgi:hypothetical protein
MHSRLRSHARAIALATLCLVLSGAWRTIGADAPLSQRESDSLQQKILSIRQYAAATPTGARLTPVSEAELNSYLRFALAADLPAGIVDPYVGIVGGGEVRGRAVVDFDAVRRSKTRGWFDPLAYVTGQVPVTASGRIVAADGRARFEFGAATVAGVGVPKAVLDEIVAFYTRTSSNQNGLSLDDTYDLPARIAEISVEPGRAIVIQR